MGNQNKSIYLIPVMLCFFCMGFVEDLVGIASNYVKEDLGLTDSVANIFPSLVFFWFLIFSVPTGMLMNKIGRKNTVLLSLVVTVVSLFIPLLGESFTVMLVAFSLLGIGNALMQTSINPLAMLIIGDKNLASTLTFGQFVLSGYVGCYSHDAVVRLRLACAVYRLLCSRRIGHLAAMGNTDSGGDARGQVIVVHGLHQAVKQTHRAAVVLRHHVSCGH